MDPAYVAAYPTLYREHWWWRSREAILLDTIRRVTARLTTPRFLDVGCGAGLFFDALSRLGDVEGIESDAAAVEASGHWRNRITLGVLDASYRPAHPFDVILMLDVLEHVTDPDALIRHADRVLSDSGTIIITVPAFRWLWTTHDELNGHKRRYTRRELRFELQRSGLHGGSGRYLFQSLVIGKALQRLKEHLVGASTHVPRVPPAFVNRLLIRWLTVENRFAGWVPFGTSVLMVARKLPDKVTRL